MKKIAFLLAIIFVSFFAVNCVTAPAKCTCECACTACGCNPEAVKETDLSYILGREWKLVAAHVNDTFPREIHFDRARLLKDNFGDIYSLKFTPEQMSGKGNPNNYASSYTITEVGKAITLLGWTNTDAYSSFYPDRLKEKDYFTYMQNAYRWELSSAKKLLLHSKTADGFDVQLTFE